MLHAAREGCTSETGGQVCEQKSASHHGGREEEEEDVDI